MYQYTECRISYQLVTLSIFRVVSLQPQKNKHCFYEGQH